ncbi:MAG: archaeal heat shock protein Hsp20 [Candidatus Altiarchaeota archaeon]
MFPGRRRRKDFFGDFFTDFDEEFKQMEENMARIFEEAMKASSEKEGGQNPFVYGFSMRVGPDGKPKIEEFGNVPNKRMLGEEELGEGREPLTDVIDGDKEVTVIAELPGIEKKDIKLEVDEKNMTIDVDTTERKYHKELKLPSEVKAGSSKASYKNGVLEVKITKAAPKKKDKKGFNVRIE